jgi:hypothetical protein
VLILLMEVHHHLILDDCFDFFFRVLSRVLLGFTGLVLVRVWRHGVWSSWRASPLGLLVIPLDLWLLRGSLWMVAGGVFVVCA